MKNSQSLHQSVLLENSIEMLKIKDGGMYVDCTLGRGGHAKAILEKIGSGTLIGLDQDIQAIDYSLKALHNFQEHFIPIQGNFGNLKMLLAMKEIFEVDGILYDLGVSSPQLDLADRGFSYRFNGPLDMRMDQNQPLTANIVINTYDEQTLGDLLFKYGDEQFSKPIAKKIVENRPINTTFELVEVIKKSLPQKILKAKKHPAKKTFQALRVFVNQELDVLEKSLLQGLEILKPQGRMVVITFQSHEEKIVRKIFKEATTSKKAHVLKNLPIEIDDIDLKFKLITKTPIKPDKTELENNNRAHSAKMWVIEKK